MSILLNAATRVIVHGINGEYAMRQTRGMRSYGTQVVAGVAEGHGGQFIEDVPVYDTLTEAVRHHPADATALYLGAARLRSAVEEAIDCGIRLLFCTADGLPVQDALILRALTRRAGVWMIGPNSAGLISPGQALLGSFAPEWTAPGRIGLMSRGGTLSLYTTRVLTLAGIGQSSAIHMGGEAVLGRNPAEYLQAFEADPDTDAIVMLSEVGGGKEHEAATVIRTMKKPVFALVIGAAVPPGTTMGHAGAMIGAEEHTVPAKRAVLAEAGATLADRAEDLPALITQRLGKTATRQV